MVACHPRVQAAPQTSGAFWVAATWLLVLPTETAPATHDPKRNACETKRDICSVADCCVKLRHDKELEDLAIDHT